MDYKILILDESEVPPLPSEINMGYYIGGTDINMYTDFVSKYGTSIFEDEAKKEEYLPMFIIGKIGQGAFGDIYSIGYLMDGELEGTDVIKIEKKSIIYPNDQSFMKSQTMELEIQRYVSELKIRNDQLCPHADNIHFFSYRGNFFSYFFMEITDENSYVLDDVFKNGEVDPDLLRFVITYVISIINMLGNVNIVHGDLHWGNLYLKQANNNTSIGIFDFGYSLRYHNRELDFFTLLRSSFNINYTDITNNTIQQMLVDYMIKDRVTDPANLENFYTINDRYNKLFEQHMKYFYAEINK
jgi:hypothetical protein